MLRVRSPRNGSERLPRDTIGGMERDQEQDALPAAERRRLDTERRLMRAAELLAGIDYREDIHRRERPTEDDLAQAIRASQESGELRHLYGKPLDLSEDTSDWLMRRILRDAGFSHPVLERGKDLETGRRAAETIVEGLRRRRGWLASPEA